MSLRSDRTGFEYLAAPPSLLALCRPVRSAASSSGWPALKSATMYRSNSHRCTSSRVSVFVDEPLGARQGVVGPFRLMWWLGIVFWVRRLWWVSACLAVVAGVAVNLVSDSLPWRGPLWILFAVAVAATAAAAWFSRPGSAVEQQDPVEALAEVVRRQWENEAGIRDVLRPDPLPVRWSTTGRPVRARAAMFRLSGRLDDVVDAFLSLPRRQLLVLGDPGSGKTVLAVLLTLGLLTKRRRGDPVPVLLSLSGWNPEAQGLDAWLAGRLAAEYPGLGRARDAVLPILDGLDELPESLLPQAIDGIDHAMAGGRPVVVTCRGAEYEAAVANGGVVLSGAAVVEIEPVHPSDALGFITAPTPVGDSRWDVVSAHLRTHPDGDVAAVLSTPLMAWLARHVYTDPTTNPVELLDFPDRSAIEKHLLNAIIRARYGRSSPRATRWLTSLAVHLKRCGTHDLAWWRLYEWTRLWMVRLWLAVLMLLMVGGWAACSRWCCSDRLLRCWSGQFSACSPAPSWWWFRRRWTAARLTSAGSVMGWSNASSDTSPADTWSPWRSSSP
jgi:hypothetical protein